MQRPQAIQPCANACDVRRASACRHADFGQPTREHFARRPGVADVHHRRLQAAFEAIHQLHLGADEAEQALSVRHAP
jgi:hypothetical protein